MSTFTGLNTMVRGIFNSQTALNTTGHNITNASTAGYSRQSANSVATGAEYRTGLYGALAIGTGVEVQTITRSRDIFADKQYRNENSTQEYFKSLARNYDNLEVIFNDSGDTGMANAIGKFYQAWVDLSANASSENQRTVVISQAKILSDLMKTDTQELQNQINSTYSDMALHVEEFNEILEGIVNSNKMIVAREAAGGNANDLRDQRDLLVDELSKYVNVNVTETSLGHYQINSGGIMLVNGIDRLHFEMSRGYSAGSVDTDTSVVENYGVADYNITIKESKQVFIPQNGILKAEFDIVEECKSYIDYMASIASFMLTTFNDQHKAGRDANGEFGENFFGLYDKEYTYGYDTQTKVAYVTMSPSSSSSSESKQNLTGVKIIEQFNVNARLLEGGGYNYVAAATTYKVKDGNDNFINYSEKLKNGEITYDNLKNSDYVLSWNGKYEDVKYDDEGNVVSRTYYDGSQVGIGDGTNAVYLSELFNLSYDTIVDTGRINSVILQRYAEENEDLIEKYGEDDPLSYRFMTALGKSCINDYYLTVMTDLAVDANTMDNKIEQQEALMVQIQNWRDSASGVDWNEELTNMIKFQKAFQSCARCLTAMDECLDRLVNNTGTVGR